MRYSLAISVAIHAAILLAAMLALPAPDTYEVEELDTIPVDIVSIEELSQRKATQKAPEKKTAEKPKPAETKREEKKPEPKIAELVQKAALEAKAEAEPAPKPVEKQPDPKPLEELIKKTEEAKPEAESKSAEAPAVKPKRKPEKPRKERRELDIDKVAALLNKIEEEPASPPRIEELIGTPEEGEFDLAGTDLKISANEIDWLRRKIRECWNPPVGVMEAQGLQVHVQIELDQSGAVLGQPAVVNHSMHPLFDVAASSAVRAILRCQPYDRLPIAKYESWRSIIFNFDPLEMFSG